MTIPWSSLDWGDAPSWANVVVTALALVAAYWAARSSWKVLQVERTREDRAERLEQERREASMRAAQADSVAAWQNYDGRWWHVVVQNLSSLPVYDVEVTFFDGMQAPRGVVKRALLPPGKTLLGWPEDWPGDILSLEHIGGDCIENHGVGDPRDFAVGMRFRDTGGRVWVRDQFGQLGLEMTLKPADYHTIALPWPEARGSEDERVC